MAEQLGSGLQNRVHRCDSGSRLASLLKVYGAADKIFSAWAGKDKRIAGVAELADAQDLKSWILRGVRVQLPPPALFPSF